MRLLLAATAVLAVMGAASPSMARDYPVCSRSATNDFNPSCSFDNFQQCQATISGIGGDCFQNPWLAYNQAPQPRLSRKASRMRAQQESAGDNGGWDSNRHW